jgi:NAD(P)-dependent dehydrogenase (short-subunit alcohol dehydrogenase family)
MGKVVVVMGASSGIGAASALGWGVPEDDYSLLGEPQGVSALPLAS